MPSTVASNDHRVPLLRAFSSRPILSYEEDKKFFTTSKKDVESILLAIDTFENALIVGEHGSGKSSLLNHISHQLHDDDSTILIKLSALNFENFDLYNFLKSVIAELREKSKQYSSKSDKILNKFFSEMDTQREQENPDKHQKESTSLSTLPNQFTSIIEHLKKNQIKICIIVDDIDKIDSNSVWLTFRNIRDQIWKLKISIILTALPNQVSKITKSPLDHFFSYWVKVSAFDFNAIQELVRRRLDYVNSNITVNDDAIEEVLRRSGGNPRDILDVFRQVFESENISNDISRQNIENVNIVFSNKLPSMEKEIFNYLVHNPNSSPSSEEFTKKMGVSRSRIAQILSKLKSQGYILSKKEGRTVNYYITDIGLERRKEL